MTGLLDRLHAGDVGPLLWPRADARSASTLSFYALSRLCHREDFLSRDHHPVRFAAVALNDGDELGLCPARLEPAVASNHQFDSYSPLSSHVASGQAITIDSSLTRSRP